MMTKPTDVQAFKRDMKLLVTYPGWVFEPIRDISKCVYNSFFDADVDTEFLPIHTLEDLNRLALKGEYSHILSVNTHDFLERDKKFYLDKPKITKLMSYNLEQTPIEGQNSSWASMRLNEVGAYGWYFDYMVTESLCKEGDIRNMGYRTLHLNLPYHPCLDMFVEPSMENKKYDVMFIGCGSERRQKVVDTLVKEGIKVAPVPLPQALGKEYKSQIAVETKICLNVHFSDMEYFEKPRIFYDFFLNKAAVLTEKILFPEEFDHMKDFYMAKYMNIVPLVLLLVNKYDETTFNMGLNAYKKFTELHHYDRVVDTFLTELLSKERGIA